MDSYLIYKKGHSVYIIEVISPPLAQLLVSFYEKHQSSLQQN